jgi:RimJ/RimL family protein N-acetyltransferase
MIHRKGGTPAGSRIPDGKTIVGSKVRLRQKRLSDARNDYRWQSDRELVRLDAAPPMRLPFAVYLLDYSGQLHAPKANRLPFAVETLDGRHIGNCTCYDIRADNGEAQLGIMIGERDYWNRGYGTDTVKTLIDHIFRNTQIRRIHLKTLDWNLRAQRCFGNCGFTPCGSLKRHRDNFIVMELRRERWQKPSNGGIIEQDE